MHLPVDLDLDLVDLGIPSTCTPVPRSTRRNSYI